MASIIGADFCSIYSRGSQFRIESLLIRVSTPMGYLLASPSKTEVSRQRAPMSLPLVMEPKSGFYDDPVLVIDFQSLYPSCISAYNLDYSSMLFRNEDACNLGGQVGVYNYSNDKHTFNKLLDNEKIINAKFRPAMWIDISGIE